MTSGDDDVALAVRAQQQGEMRALLQQHPKRKHYALIGDIAWQTEGVALPRARREMSLMEGRAR